MKRKWKKPTRPNHRVQLGITIYGIDEQAEEWKEGESGS